LPVCSSFCALFHTLMPAVWATLTSGAWLGVSVLFGGTMVQVSEDQSCQVVDRGLSLTRARSPSSQVRDLPVWWRSWLPYGTPGYYLLGSLVNIELQDLKMDCLATDNPRVCTSGAEMVDLFGYADVSAAL
jgi:hypothetical protein